MANKWFTAVEQTAPEYIPLPMEQLFQAGQAIQGRHDSAIAKMDEIGTGLSSIQTRLSGHRDYVNKISEGYKKESSDLLTKYGNNASDPQFQREFSRIKTKYANDRNLNTIMLANEAAKRNDDIAAKLAAEGKLYVNPNATGLDANGNIVSDIGQIRQVDTLDNIEQRLKIAANTKTERGNLITNKPALEQAQKEILSSLKSGSPEFIDLIQAYKTRGMSDTQAMNQVAQDVTRLSGQYAVSEETNWQKMNYGLRAQEAALGRQEHSLKMQKLRLELNALAGTGSQFPAPTGVVKKGIISGADMNKDQLNLVGDFRKYIGKDGNLAMKDNRGAVNKTYNATSGSTYGMGTGGAFMSNSGASKSKEKSVIDTLKYMRNELGWSNTKGSAKQVADAYESMIKSDNLVPTVYKPGNSTIINGIEALYGDNFEGATIYEDGKKKQANDPKTLKKLEQDAKFMGISMKDGGSVVFRSFKDDKPVTISIPLDDQSRQLFTTNLSMSNILDKFKDNKDLESAVKANPSEYLKSIGKDFYAPRKTSQGLRYAKVKGDGGNSIQFDRNSKNELEYLDDSLVKQLLSNEFSMMDSRLQQIIK